MVALTRSGMDRLSFNTWFNLCLAEYRKLHFQFLNTKEKTKTTTKTYPERWPDEAVVCEDHSMRAG